MRYRMLHAVTAALLVMGVAMPAFAEDDLDVTMEVIEEDADEARFVRQIELPAGASEQARESAADGHETANEARERGREFGQERAREARERGRDGGGPPDGRGAPGGPPGR